MYKRQGYEGTSLAELAKSTGLKKASLYHRFPKGKEEMANAVLAYIEEWVDVHIFEILLDESLPSEERLQKALVQIRNSYDNGKETCIFRALSIGQSLELFDLQIKNGMYKWVSAFTKFGVAIGLSETKANESALHTLIKIQGSLIVTKVMSDLSIFESTLQEIEATYITAIR